MAAAPCLRPATVTPLGCARAPRAQAIAGRLRRCLRGLVWGLMVGVLAAGGALAQALPMRSGEHAGFTRLTLPVAAGQSWTLGRVRDGYGLRLGDGAAPIDTSAVFTRIPRTRLRALRPAASGVDLVLGCDCHAVVFREGRLLVIDLRDGPPPPGAQFETRLAGPREPPAHPRPVFDWTQQFVPPAQRLDQAEAAELPGRAYEDDGSAARDLLAQQFSRAMAQGLIAPDVAPARRRLGLAPDPAAAVDPLANLRIGAQTAIDRAQSEGGHGGVDRDGVACPPDSFFDVSGWADDRPLLAQLADLRRGLLGEFDRPEPDGVLRLARLYLNAGFGAEAQALLETLSISSQESTVLQELARIIDSTEPLPDGVLRSHVGCDNAAALWAVLAVPDLAAAGTVERTAVRRAFAALPPHLRRHLGPPLAQRFLEISDTETAQSLRNAIVGDTGPQAGLAVLDAGLELAQGRPEAASRRAQAAADSSEADAPIALATMLEARLAAGLPLAPGTADNLTGLAQLHAGSPLGQRLGRLEAIALATEGHVDAAFSVRDRLRLRGASEAEARALSLELVAVVSQVAEDAVFVPRLLSEDVWRAGRLAQGDRLHLAERMIEAGFPEQALAALRPEDTSVEEAVMIARAAMAAGRPADGLRAVADHTGSQADGLRAEALLALGEHRAAIAAFNAAGRPDDAERAARLGGMWGAVARPPDADAPDTALRLSAAQDQPQPAAQAAGVATSTAAAPPGTSDAGTAPGDGPLAEAAALLDQGADLRRRVEKLLSVDGPAPP